MNSSTSQNRQPKSSENSVSNRIAGKVDDELSPLADLQNYARQYVDQQPEMAAIICLGIGFVLGWKLKPW
ncbi:MAG: hypothetical protein H7Z17_14820 [Fuerstia sp.]|nr:hypothetical protein [Fuerstiella sp.]